MSAAGIARPLLAWYDGARRDLAWRRAPTPYKTLVSEFMLQQTGVATVEPYFARFLERFPSLRALAAASDDDVTALWSGLGYYARARNLRRAAAAIVAEHGGRVPETEAALRSLPGVGPYTAAAIAAIAFDAPAFALDGNAARVMARLAGERAPIDLPATRAALHARGLGELPRARSGDFNQAVMELGATVCTPRRPRCDACPLAAACRARAAGLAAELPTKRARPARPIVRVVCACVTDGASVLLTRRASGLLAGTWSLLQTASPGDDAESRSPGRPGARAAARRLAEDAGLRVARVAYRGSVRHVFTHRDVTADVFRVETGRAEPAPGTCRWVGAGGLGALGVSSFTKKTVAAGMTLAGISSTRAKRDKVAVRP